MTVSNMQPLKHHTTFSMNMALLIYTLMDSRAIHLGRIINNSMYHATIGASDQRLPFPVFISRMAVANEVPYFLSINTSSLRVRTDFARLVIGRLKRRKLERPQPATPSAAEEPFSSSSCTNLFQKILKKLRRWKKDLRNTQYMIRTANPGVEFPDLIPVTSSDSTDEDNA
ncbi:hypothetical protein PIB30_092740 [Stylosanthes scabra]|uniref:Uncharacterized protein n=1 Tax=Stylosanthes scabra TaxID=79078 RepID=A0ABU6VTF4_9FABA|nr:hypothetical protein [Stylosanthes scabra]